MQLTPSLPVGLALCLAVFVILVGCGHHGGRGQEHALTQREAEIRLDLAEAHLRNNEPRLALRELNLIQAQAQTLPRFHFILGYTRLLLGNGLDAVAAFRRSVEMDPDHAEAWNNLGLALLSINQVEEAEKAFNAALAISTYRTPEVAALNLAQLYMDSDRRGLALQYANLALELNWRFTKAYLLAAEIELSRGNAERAVALLSQGAEANLGDPRILLTLAEYLILAGQNDQALIWLDRLLDTAPDSPEAITAAEYKQSLGGRQAAFTEQKGLVMEPSLQETAQPEPAVRQIAKEAPIQPDPGGASEQPSPETLPESVLDALEDTLEDAWEAAYIVQVGAFLDKTRAEKLRSIYKSKGYPARITQITRKGKTWHLVYIAATQSHKEADEIAERFGQQEDKDVVVVRVGRDRYLEMTSP